MADDTDETRARDGGRGHRGHRPGGAGRGGAGAPEAGIGGRRLEVRVQPDVTYVTWWLTPQGDGLRQAVTDSSASGPLGGIRPVGCVAGDSMTASTWWAWPIHPDRPYDGAAVGRLLLAASDTVAASFHAGRLIHVRARHPRPGARPTPAGVLDAPAATPGWLPEAVRAYHRWRAAGPVIEARHRWQSAVEACSVTADGRELWCTGSGYRDEMLAGFDVEQTPERVTVRAWLAFGPDGPTSFGTGPVRTLPDGRRLGRMYRQAASRRWSTVVYLDQPLGERPVVDVGIREPDGAGRARRAWLAERE
ncbi:hypothetical protein ACG83_33295 [Frankia sp. R43]|uniref:hypothetical protein n=1 Tax=Frankia sp. R43 TaxID=269536 RepID=UPI0006CA123B|nr:hypothetical protein [Frankia sp. R43]KPM51701.1 hypothetical protein ACG83_33295 [Frankia sp. R43]